MHRDQHTRLDRPTTFPGAGMLVLRGVVGATFLLHGLDKLDDLPNTAQAFASLDIPAPNVAAPFVAIIETGGGALLVAGLATPLVGAVLATNMVVAMLTAHSDLRFFASDGGIEFELLLGSACVAIGLAGAGRFSLDAALHLPQRSARRVSAMVRALRRGTVRA